MVAVELHLSVIQVPMKNTNQKRQKLKIKQVSIIVKKYKALKNMQQPHIATDN